MPPPRFVYVKSLIFSEIAKIRELAQIYTSVVVFAIEARPASPLVDRSKCLLQGPYICCTAISIQSDSVARLQYRNPIPAEICHLHEIPVLLLRPGPGPEYGDREYHDGRQPLAPAGAVVHKSPGYEACNKGSASGNQLSSHRFTVISFRRVFRRMPLPPASVLISSLAEASMETRIPPPHC